MNKKRQMLPVKDQRLYRPTMNIIHNRSHYRHRFHLCLFLNGNNDQFNFILTIIVQPNVDIWSMWTEMLKNVVIFII